MRYFSFLLVWAAVACTSKYNNNNGVNTPLVIVVETTDTSLHHVNGLWMRKGNQYNGYIIEKDSNRIVAKLPVVDGRENGTAYGWYTNGQRKQERHFVQGNREGVQRGWYKNGVLSFEYFFYEDKYEGEQRTYFESGHIWQDLHYVNGYEEGKQKSYNDSGRVINNFTVKNKKLYGVIGRYDCMSVYKK